MVDTDIAACGDAQSRLNERNTSSALEREKRRRFSAMGAIAWAPSPEFSVKVDALYSNFNNKILDVTAQGLAGLENAMRMDYDGANRVVRTESGAFGHFDEADYQRQLR